MPRAPKSSEKGSSASRILPCASEEWLKKVCPKCGIEKPVVEFHRNRGGVLGRESWCICCKKRQKVENKGVLPKPRISRIGSSPKRKFCSCCEQEKPLEDFSPNSWGALGRASRCRSCYNAIKGRIRAEDPEHKKALDIEYRKRNRERIREFNRNYMQRNKERISKKVSEKRKEWYRNATPEKIARWQAQRLANMAVKKGDLFKPSNCSRCGKGGRIEGHHFDYSEPLAVMWLCPPCHWQADHEGVLK